jgi:serine/threonine protein kinase
MMKMRKVLTEPEVRYFMAQMVTILTKLKKQNIVHRE